MAGEPEQAAAPLRLAPFLLAAFRPRAAGERLPRLGWPATVLAVFATAVLLALVFDLTGRIGWIDPFQPLLTRLRIAVQDLSREVMRGAIVLEFLFANGILFVAAFLTLPRASADDSIFSAWRRALLVVCAAASVIVVISAFAFAVLWLSPQTYYWFWTLRETVLLPVGSIWLLWAGGRIADGYLPPPGELARNHCDACGYDLRGRLEADRCAECGREVALSLDPHRARTKNPWTRDGDFVRTVAQVVARPVCFFREVRVREPIDRAQGFVWRVGGAVFVLGTFVASVVLVALNVVLGPGPDLAEQGALALTIGLWSVAVGQIAHATLSTLALFWLRWRNPLPDDRWLAHAACYELAFAVIPLGFVLFSGVVTLIVIIIAFETNAPVWFAYPATLAFFVLLAGVVAWWLVRFVRIAGAIRWSNF